MEYNGLLKYDRLDYIIEANSATFNKSVERVGMSCYFQELKLIEDFSTNVILLSFFNTDVIIRDHAIDVMGYVPMTKTSNNDIYKLIYL